MVGYLSPQASSNPIQNFTDFVPGDAKYRRVYGKQANLNVLWMTTMTFTATNTITDHQETTTKEFIPTILCDLDLAWTLAPCKSKCVVRFFPEMGQICSLGRLTTKSFQLQGA